MKKIISLVLAVMMLVSAVPMVYAADTDYTNGTTVTYNGTGTEAYTVTVPAELAPGSNGTVTAQGTWPSNKTLEVTSDKTVELVNNINGSDTKVLNITFDGIELAGSNTVAVSTNETVSVADIDDALFGTWSGHFNYYVSFDGALTVESLQQMYDFEYYSTLNGAVNDVNADTIGASADVDKADAVAGIYTDENGGVNVVLLKDHTENGRITTAADMTINLGGNTLTIENDYFGIYGQTNGTNTVTIDGRLDGSAIILNGIDGGGQAITTRTNTFILNGGKYVINETIRSDSYTAYAICTSAGGILYANDCEIVANSTNTRATVGVISFGTSTLTNCEIKAYNSYTGNESVAYTAFSNGVAIENGGAVTLNNCYAFGTHAGITGGNNGGSLEINGGVYEGYGHGGVYFSCAEKTYYVKNAILRHCEMPEGYAVNLRSNNAGFYIGGSAGKDNITVYMDNCDIYGSEQPIVLRGTDGEQNNTLYISNSRINKDYTQTGVRIDNNTHKLYIGTGCNFTAEDTTLPEAVVVTDETYIYNG